MPLMQLLFSVSLHPSFVLPFLLTSFLLYIFGLYLESWALEKGDIFFSTSPILCDISYNRNDSVVVVSIFKQ